VEYIATALIEQSIYFKNVQESKNSSNFNLSDLSKSLYNINSKKNYFPQKSPSADTILLSSTTKAAAAAASAAANSTKNENDKASENKKTLESKSDDLISKGDEKDSVAAAPTSTTVSVATPPPFTATSITSEIIVKELETVQNVIPETKEDCTTINTESSTTTTSNSTSTSDDLNNNDDNIVISDFDDQGLRIVEENILVDLTINDENAPPSQLKQGLLKMAPLTGEEVSLHFLFFFYLAPLKIHIKHKFMYEIFSNNEKPQSHIFNSYSHLFFSFPYQTRMLFWIY
jgi:hypothetical protein